MAEPTGGAEVQSGKTNGGDVVDRLVALAGEGRSLSSAQLRRVVPVDTMPVEDLATLIARIEDRGVTVDIDPALLSPRGRPSEGAGTTAPAWSPPEPPPAERPAAPMAQAPGPSPARPARPAGRSRAVPPRSKSATRSVVLALLIVIILVLAWTFLS